MKASYLLFAAALIASQTSRPSLAHAAETLSASGVQEDAFGNDDPFAVIGAENKLPHQDAVESGIAGNKPQARAEVFFKAYNADINMNSRVNPGNRIQKLKEITGAAETRVTISDSMAAENTLRWLFKGFAAGPDYHEADGTQRGKESRIDELFVDWRSERLFVSAGKRRVNWGHAQGFNPVNVVAPQRDPLNPGYQSEGQPLVWGSFSGAIGVIDIILTRNYDENWNSDKYRWGLKLGYSGSDIDFAVYYFDGEEYSAGKPFERMLGASFAAEAAPGVTLYAEGARVARNYRPYYSAAGSALNTGEGYFQGVIGSSISLGGKSSMFIEYLYNGQGYSNDERGNYLRAVDAMLANSAAQAISGDFTLAGLNRRYLLASVKKEYREKYNFGISVIVAEDKSNSTRAEVSYAISDYYEAQVSYLDYSGGMDSEFGANPYRGLLEISLKASF
ncbi:MAG: hypothetical protein HY751_02185 [Nitrospinae bacterium]|nr:hypothetical protein [Nitrospinota bacterium]